jgi:hypothetical protein
MYWLGYNLDVRYVVVWFPEGVRDLSPFQIVRTGGGVHPAPDAMGTKGYFPGDIAAEQ